MDKSTIRHKARVWSSMYMLLTDVFLETRVPRALGLSSTNDCL